MQSTCKVLGEQLLPEVSLPNLQTTEREKAGASIWCSVEPCCPYGDSILLMPPSHIKLTDKHPNIEEL